MISMLHRAFTSNWIVKYMPDRRRSSTGRSRKPCSKDRVTEITPFTSTPWAMHTFQNSVVLQSEISERSQCRLKVRRSIVATDRFYPLVRVTELIALDPTVNEEEVIDVLAIVADHIQVKLRPGASPFDLQSLNEKLGGRLRRNLYVNGTYLISFSNPDIHTVTSALIAYNRESVVVQHAEPDFILRAQSLS